MFHGSPWWARGIGAAFEDGPIETLKESMADFSSFMINLSCSEP
jgi:hypothetical protein